MLEMQHTLRQMRDRFIDGQWKELVYEAHCLDLYVVILFVDEGMIMDNSYSSIHRLVDYKQT